MRFRLALLAIAAVLIAAAPPSNQCTSYNDLLANQAGNFSWSGTPPTAGPSLVTYARYKALVSNTTAAPCPTGIPDNQEVTWNVVISCAVGHGASQQSMAISGNYHTVTYTATFNSHTGFYVCNGPNGSDSYTGVPITLPAGTVAPSSSTPLSITLTSITYPGTSTSITVQLKDPSGSVRFTVTNATETTYTYTGAGAAGSWSWVITQVGGSDGACDPNNGVTNFGGTQMTFSGSVSWFQ